MLSLNAKELNVPEKRRMLLQDLHCLKTNLTVVQETYFRDDKLPLLKNRFFPMAYHSTNLTAKSWGVSVLISSNVPWTCLDTVTDSEGCFLFLKGMIGGVKVTLANFYVPNSHQDLFIDRNLD